MKLIYIAALVLSFAFPVFAGSFNDLEALAAAKTKAQARVTLSEDAGLKNIKNADLFQSGNVPNYIKALAQNTKSAPQFADLVQAFIFGGTVRPEIKMAMGLEIAEATNSAYTFAQTQRWLRGSENGQKLLGALRSNKLAALSPAEQAAMRYAQLLTDDVHGITDEEFQKVRGFYNDSQLVELTMVVCFFNHFTRFVEATNVPVETWVLSDKQPQPPAALAKYSAPYSRVALISDNEMAATQKVADAAKTPQTPQQGLGITIANSQRAMFRVPEMAAAWRDFGFQNRQNWTIDRNIQLQISFAVSMANGCRYCTLHQVLGLRRLGVDPAKLMAMKKDDSALTPRELTAVEFARKLTKAPASVTGADFAKVKTEFGEQGAVEVVLQTGAFAFMNRFTDNLRLPSEDEAVKNYEEVYGQKSFGQNWKF